MAPLTTAPLTTAQALRTELTKCGATVVEEGDTLSVPTPTPPHPTPPSHHTHHTHHTHRNPTPHPLIIGVRCIIRTSTRAPAVLLPHCTPAPLHPCALSILHPCTSGAPLYPCTPAPLHPRTPLQVACTAVAQLGSATVHTYHDHRMAMCFATLGLAVGGVKLEDPSCVRAARLKKGAARSFTHTHHTYTNTRAPRHPSSPHPIPPHPTPTPTHPHTHIASPYPIPPPNQRERVYTAAAACLSRGAYATSAGAQGGSYLLAHSLSLPRHAGAKDGALLLSDPRRTAAARPGRRGLDGDR